MNVNREIERLEYTLATVSLDHGHGPNPCKLDIAFMERRLVLLRAYRDLEPADSDMDAIMAGVGVTAFGNLAETDPVMAGIRNELLREAA
jgi:hypothetical protein